jgi:UDPglucose 6-dehydrogenase
MRGIAVCGLGKLGAPIAAVFAASDVPTVGFDLDIQKVQLVNARQAPVAEPDLQDYLDLSTVRNNLSATINVQDAVQLSDACLFVTATPSLSDGSFDHGHLLTAIAAVAREVARQGRRNYLFIVNSTVTPGFCAGRAAPLLDRLLGKHYGLAYKPEFIALGTVIRDLHHPSLLLIGADSESASRKVEELYRQMVCHNPPAKHMSLVEAELAKISLNCAITMKISFANQVGLVAKRMGASQEKILDAIGADPRVGHLALRAGLPFGGPCFPRDNRMFQYVATMVGERSPMAEATDIMNKRMLRSVLEQVQPHGDVGILGLAYKSGTPISDDSPGQWWKQALQSRGRRVRAHDVMAVHTHSMAQVLDCPTIIVACDWPEYRKICISHDTVLIDPMGIVQEVVQQISTEAGAAAL